MTRTSHRALAAASVLAALLMAGCTAREPVATIAPQAAVSAYGPVRAELLAALTALNPNAAWDDDGEPYLSKDEHQGTCTLVFPQATSHQYLAPMGTFAEAGRALNPILLRHGFSTLGNEEFTQGGEVTVTATGPNGAEVKLTSELTSRVSFTAVIRPAACGDAAITALTGIVKPWTTPT